MVCIKLLLNLQGGFSFPKKFMSSTLHKNANSPCSEAATILQSKPKLAGSLDCMYTPT